MAYLAGNMNIDTDMLLESYHQVAAVGAIILFLSESALITLFAVAWGKSEAAGSNLAEPRKS